MHTRISALVAFGISICAASAVFAAGGGGGASGSVSGSSGADPNKAFKQGIDYLQEGECAKAEKKFRTVVKAVPKNPEANFYRASAHKCQGEHKDAAKYFGRAAKYDKQMYQAYEQAGISYLAIGKREDAQEQLDKLSAMQAECGDTCSPTLIGAHQRLSAAMNGTPPATGDQNSLLFEGDKEPQAAYLSAVEHINAGRFDVAIVELRQITAAIGPHPDVMNYLGYTHRKMGYFDEAEAYYMQALALDPRHRGANEYLGELYVERREFDKANERLAILEEVCPFGCAEYEDLKQRIDSSVVAGQ